jgi:synaptobrevin family protein YKT6
LGFFCKTIVERTEKGVRQSVEENEHVVHAYTNLAGLACVIIGDKEYPPRVAFALINRVLEEFTSAFSRDVWLTTSGKLDYPQLKDMLAKYQNPHEADPIMRVQKELDETKIVLVRFWCLFNQYV